MTTNDCNPPQEALPACGAHGDLQPPVTVKRSSACRTLLDSATRAVAACVEVEEIAIHIEYLPAVVRRALLHHLQDDRLRYLERALQSQSHIPSNGFPATVVDFFVPEFEADFQVEWTRRCEIRGYHVTPAISTDTLFRASAASKRPRDPRRIYWEHRFRGLVCAEPTAHGNPPFPPDLSLYCDIVKTLKLNARDLQRSNVSMIQQLPRLKRLELHHLTEHNKSAALPCLETLLSTAPVLEELGLFHGRLTAETLSRITTALLARSKTLASDVGVTSIELVSVKLKTKADHRQLVSLFEKCINFATVRLSSTITDFDNRRLLRVLLQLPHLESLSLEHNDLEDDALAGLTSCSFSTPLPLRELRLDSNALSVVSMQTLSSLALDGRLPSLERLELRGNQEIGDAGVHALALLFSSSCCQRLTHVDLRNCHFGVEGAATLLNALGENQTVESLDLSQNFFGSGFGDLLADFLLTNDTLQRLHVNYVGLGHAGCTERLQVALRTNQSLRVLSIGANRLRDQGALLILRAIAARARVAASYEALDLSGNLLTVDGLCQLKCILEQRDADDEDGTDSDDEPPIKQRRLCVGREGKPLATSAEEDLLHPLIEELGLLNNDFGGREATTMRAEDVLQELGRLVGKVLSNEWSTRRNVYDDEV